MGQQAPKSFPPPGEYRGIGADSASVAQVQPLSNSASIATSPLPMVPMIQSPNSVSVSSGAQRGVAIDGTTGQVTSPKQASIANPLNLNSRIGNLGTLQNGA